MGRQAGWQRGQVLCSSVTCIDSWTLRIYILGDFEYLYRKGWVITKRLGSVKNLDTAVPLPRNVRLQTVVHVAAHSRAVRE